MGLGLKCCYFTGNTSQEIDGESFSLIKGSETVFHNECEWKFHSLNNTSNCFVSAAFQASSVCQPGINLLKKFQSGCFHQGPFFAPCAKQWKAHMGRLNIPLTHACTSPRTHLMPSKMVFYLSPRAPQLSLRAAVRLCCTDERQCIVPGCVRHKEGRRRLSTR